jgi:hypothetical protein
MPRAIVRLGLALCAVLMCVSAVQTREEKLVVGASVRIRYELQDNYNQKYYGPEPAEGPGHDGFALGRFQAGFDYCPLKKVHIALQGQDAEAWDMALRDDVFYNKILGMQHNPNKDHWELSDAYLEIKEPFDAPVFLNAGRQRLAYGNNRVFGPGTWGNSGRWIWDAVKVSLKFSEGFYDAYYGRTMVHQPLRFSLSHRHFYESYGFYGHYAFPERYLGLVIEPFFMTKIDAHDTYAGEDGESGQLSTYYAGGRSCVKNLRGFDFDVTYVKQAGDYGTDNLDADGYNVLVAYNIRNVGARPRIGAGYTYASGDSDPNDGVHETFDGAFGSRAKTYGRMNLFQWMNLKNAEISLELRPAKWCYLKTEFHRFWLAEERDGWYLNAKEYRDKSGESGDDVGKEFDIALVLSLPLGNEIQAGFGHFWPHRFAEAQASSRQANWMFLQWTTAISWDAF